MCCFVAILFFEFSKQELKFDTVFPPCFLAHIVRGWKQHAWGTLRVTRNHATPRAPTSVNSGRCHNRVRPEPGSRFVPSRRLGHNRLGKTSLKNASAAVRFAEHVSRRAELSIVRSNSSTLLNYFGSAAEVQQRGIVPCFQRRERKRQTRPPIETYSFYRPPPLSGPLTNASEFVPKLAPCLDTT